MISPVRRLAVTLLIALYCMLLMWGTVDRTYSWALKQSEAMSVSDMDRVASLVRLRPVNPLHQAHRRILSNPFVMDPPVLAAWIVLMPQSLHQSTDLPVIGQGERRLSGRAPPRSL